MAVALWAMVCLASLWATAECAPAAASPADVEVVHVVTMNHLDVGFNGIDPTIGYARNVINKYFDVYFPKSVRVSKALERRGGPAQMIYTTHAFLVSLFLHCPPGMGLHCPDAAARSDFVDAVHRGYIRWHAFPFNAEPELLDESLFKFGVTLAHDLDRQFNLTPAITMSQRDVPGMTRSVIPLLRASGVRAVSVGVNSASAPPALPKAFVWRDPASGERVLGMYHPNGYGGISLADCVWGIPGLSHALCFEFEGDNAGPPTRFQVEQDHRRMQREFPNAKVVASTFDAFVRQLETVQDSLPVFDNEIGDTWIYGAPSDPLKLASFRAVQRARSLCEASGDSACSNSDPRFYNFSRILIKNAEHTWGVDVKKVLNDWGNWSNAQFEAARSAPNYRAQALSWVEQRAFITWAVEALAPTPAHPTPHPLVPLVEAEMAALRAGPPLEDGQPVGPWTAVPLSHLPALQLASGAGPCGAPLLLRLDNVTGAITHLEAGGEAWADAQHPLALFQYRTYDAASYAAFFADYCYCPSCDWAHKDFGKPNVSEAHPLPRRALPALRRAWAASAPSSSASAPSSSALAEPSLVLLEAELPEWAWRDYGAPRSLVLLYNASQTSPRVDVDVWLRDKTATRLPEAAFFSFVPPDAPVTDAWTFHKLGEDVRVSEVVVNGSFHLHAVTEHRGVAYTRPPAHAAAAAPCAALRMLSRDAPLACAGEPTPFPSPLAEPDVTAGVHYSLFNNIWGTNYVMWYPFEPADATLHFRFALELHP